MRNRLTGWLGGVAVCLGLVGCQSAQKTIPHLGLGRLDMQADLSREDLVVLDAVEGQSSISSILCGLIKVIDGNKLRLFGISFFKDKFTYFNEDRNLFDILGGVDAEDRAYYKALEQTPDADFVLFKSMDREESGIPFFFSSKEVTFRGKAMRLKANQ